ncbi:MAG: hypothetical protein U0441_04705 [Polyangiaceae bacterium]
MRKLAVLFVALLSGCGVVKVSVNGGGASNPGASNGSSGAESSGNDSSGSDEGARLKKAYDELDAKGTCAGQNAVWCGAELRKTAGIKQETNARGNVVMWNPREGKNPDPEWVTGWDGLPATEGFNEAERVFNVLGQALLDKANRKACEADYKPKYEALKKQSDELDAKIDAALKEPVMHDRLHALLALRPTGDLRFVGARFRLETEIGKLATTPALEAAFAWIHTVAPDAADVRPLLSAEKEARWACMRGNEGWYHKEELDASKDEMKKARSLPSEQKAPTVVALTDNQAFKAPFLGIDTAKVTSITREGLGATITLESSREEIITLGCARTSNRVVIENNTLQRDKSCTYGTKTWFNTVKLTFADLPRADILKGDELHLLADITEVSVKETSKTGSKQREDRKFGGKGAMVLDVKRNGASVWRVQP